MIPKKLFLAAAILLGAATPSWAQGVFDMGALTKSLSTDGGPNGGGVQSGLTAAPAAVPADVKKQFIFKFSPAVRKQTYATFVKQMAETHPAQAKAYEDIFAQNDVLAMLDQQLGTLGLAGNNVSDAMTGYFLTLYMMANGRTDDNTAEEIASVQKQVDAILAGVPALLKASDAEKQNMAESMWMVVFTSTVEVEAAKADPKKMAELQNAAKGLFQQQFKMDISAMTLTPQGFVRKGK
jgi:hypothetical protein